MTFTLILMLILPGVDIPIKQALGAEQPQYILYKNSNYGFSIEYPATWYHEDLTASAGNLSPIAYFAPDATTTDTWLSVNYQKDSTALRGLSGQQILNTLISTMQHNCQQYSLKLNGFTCSNPQFKSNVETYRGLPSYEILNTWTKTLSDGSTLDMISIWAVVPVQNDLYAIVIRISTEAASVYQSELNHMLSSFDVYSITQEPVTQKTDYSDFGLEKGESISYKYSMAINASDVETKQAVTNTMLQSLAKQIGDITLDSIDDIQWIKYTITNVSSTNILFNEETKVRDQEAFQNQRDIKYLQGMVIPTTAKIGDSFDIFSSGGAASLQGTVKRITTIKLGDIDVPVFELSGSTRNVSQDGTTVTTLSATAHYDKKTGLMLNGLIDLSVIGAKYVKMHMEVNTLDWSELGKTSVQSSQTTTDAVPAWIKNTAKWWSEGSVTDSDFIKGIQYMIQQGLIKIPTTTSVTKQSQTIPSWIKNTAKWWSEGSVTDSDFIKGLQYLVQNGIIVTTENTSTSTTQPTNKETSSDILTGAFLYSGKYLTPQIITYADKNGKSLTMLAYPGQALLVVSPDTSLDTISQMISSNGGTVLTQVPKLGVYLVKVDNVAKFITSAYQSKFVIYVGPNGIESSRAVRVQSGNFQYYEVQNIDDWRNISSPDPKAKVLLVQIDDFSGEKSPTETIHGVDVSKQSDPESKGISVLHLNTDFSHANVAINLQVAAWLAEKYNQKLVINTSFGPDNRDKNPQIEEADTKMLLAPLMNTKWFQQGNVILAKAAGNDGADIGSQSSNLQNDPIFGTASRSFITTGEVEDYDTTQLAQYEGGTSSNYGNGVVFTTSNASCGSGTSCATYTTATTAAYIWSLHPDIKSGSMTEIIKTSSTPPTGGNYPIISMANAYNEANRVTKCAPNCLPLGAKTNTGTNPANQQTPTTPLTTIPSNSVTIVPLQIHVNRGSCTVNKYCDVLIATATGGLAPYHFQSDTFRNGAPPFGMTIGIYGHITGTPTREGSYNFGVCVTDTAGKSNCSTTTLTIKPSEQTVNLTGHWSGTFTLVDVYEGITCKFESTFESDLIQSDNALSGTVSYASASSETTLAGGTTPIHCSFGGLTYSLSGSVSPPSFTISSSDGELHASGSFTSNTIQGTFTACGAEGCDKGSFSGSKR